MPPWHGGSVAAWRKPPHPSPLSLTRHNAFRHTLLRYYGKSYCVVSAGQTDAKLREGIHRGFKGPPDSREIR